MFCEAVTRSASPSLGDKTTVQLYGWDAVRSTWYGPNELSRPRGTRQLAAALRRAPGQSWFGAVECRPQSGMGTRYFAVAHKLPDCAAAMIYCGDSKAGPGEIVIAIPPALRGRMRDEFAFELVSFAGFLGSVGADSTLAVHDHIAQALAEAEPNDALVFSLSNAGWAGDQDYLLSQCVEKVAAAMLDWMA